MTSTQASALALLAACDTARMTPLLSEADRAYSLADAYAIADEIRGLRLARGERPLGYKIGFTNRGIWDRYGVHAPIWGPVWDTTVEFVSGQQASVSLAPFVQPRLEPEIMFGFARAPRAGMSEAELAGCIEWVAHGYEIVHTHFEGWRFRHTDTVADFALHGRLFVGKQVKMSEFADAPRELASVHVALHRDDEVIDEGDSSIVLDGPLSALRIWVDAMAAQPQRWPIVAGDIVTTGTITDAAPMLPGQRFQTQLSDSRLPGIALHARA
jgi:2-oxo-3-hexenedioate decarboxylase